MARQARNTPGGLVYHVLNRAAGKKRLFAHRRDFEAFERVMLQAHEHVPLRILSFCVMSNHWHFVVWPRKDDELTDFFRWLAHTHAMRWRVAHDTVGEGPLYQGRFKSFPIEQDEHLISVCRYVERNPVAANAALRAQDWRCGSLWTRRNGTAAQQALLSDWPIDRPANWLETVNRPLRETQLEAIQTSIKRGRPLGTREWIDRMAARLDLGHTMRKEGRPAKSVTKN